MTNDFDFTDASQGRYQPRPKKAKETSKLGMGCLALVLLVIGIGVIGNLASKKNGDKEEPNNPIARVGEEARLHSETGTVNACISKEAFDEYMKIAVANDKHGFVQMVVTGRIAVIDSGTGVLVIDSSGLGRKEVRILEGPYVGKAFFVPTEHVRK